MHTQTHMYTDTRAHTNRRAHMHTHAHRAYTHTHAHTHIISNVLFHSFCAVAKLFFRHKVKLMTVRCFPERTACRRGLQAPVPAASTQRMRRVSSGLGRPRGSSGTETTLRRCLAGLAWDTRHVYSPSPYQAFTPDEPDRAGGKGRGQGGGDREVGRARTGWRQGRDARTSTTLSPAV